MLGWLRKTGSFVGEMFKQVPKDLLADTVFSTVAIGVYHWWTGRRKESLKEPGLGVDVRAQVETDMIAIEREIGRKLAHIRKWHKQANENQFPYSENDFMVLLGKISPEHRAGVYVEWDALPRNEFIQRLDSLDHNPVEQKAQRVWFFSRPYRKEGWKKVEEFGPWLKQQADAASQKRSARENYYQVTGKRAPCLRSPVLWALVIALGLPSLLGMWGILPNHAHFLWALIVGLGLFGIWRMRNRLGF